MLLPNRLFSNIKHTQCNKLKLTIYNRDIVFHIKLKIIFFLKKNTHISYKFRRMENIGNKQYCNLI